MNSETYTIETPTKNWIEIISKYSTPDNLKSWWQIVNTVIPYIALWFAMYYSIEVSYWLTLLLSVIAAGFLVRIFIIFHDCGHGSFFKSEKLSRWVGVPLGLLVFTPYHRWHYDHKQHHMTVGNLDKRGIGDVNTLTVDEYKSLSRGKKLWYRVYRNPLFLILFIPLILFVLLFRTTKSYMDTQHKIYVHLSTLAIGILVSIVIWLIGFKAFIMIQLPILFLASVGGVWLFYVQHQYEGVSWKRTKDWNYKEIALQGSSFYKLPAILQWFSGNIGFHHIHHLGPRIPNYKLEKCHYENESLWNVKPISLIDSLKSLRLRLWDEQNQKLVGFGDI